jgi:dCMP deaminase
MDWDIYFLKIAKTVSEKSKDPRTKVGAVITRDNQPISFGFNGFPKGIKDTSDRLNNRETKHSLVLHAEENAILFAQQDLTGASIYTWPFMTCPRCSLKVIQVGIERVVFPEHERNLEFSDSFFNYEEAGVDVKIINSFYYII